MLADCDAGFVRFSAPRHRLGAEDVDAPVRLANEAAAKGLPAGLLTNKSVLEHRLVGVSYGCPMMLKIGNVGSKY
jgi:hypothetical protein